MPTSQTLNGVAAQLIACILSEPTFNVDDLGDVIYYVLDQENLTTLLGLAENDRQGFKPHRNVRKDALVEVDLKALLLDWVAGVEIQDLADTHLTAISDENYRSEALAEFTHRSRRPPGIRSTAGSAGREFDP